MNQSFMSAMEVAEELGVSKAYAYKVIRELNEELRSKGFAFSIACESESSHE